MSQREDILDAVKDRIDSKFGPEGTVTEAMFREVDRGMWSPNAVTRPRCIVTDDGQKRQGVSDTEDAKTLALNIKIFCDLVDNWERPDNFATWSGYIQTLALDRTHGLQNWLPSTVAGMMEMNYVGDDPFDVLLANGEQAALWVVEFEAVYFTEVGTLEKT